MRLASSNQGIKTIVIGFAALLLLGALPVDASADSLSESLSAYVAKEQKDLGGSAKIGISVYNVQTGESIYSKNGNEMLTPASVQKLLLTLVALKELKSGYRFPTDIYVDRLPQIAKGAVGNIYFKGFGDPSLVTETLADWIQKLRGQGLTSVNDVVVDDLEFVAPRERIGLNPFEAGSSATSLNYNCFQLQVSPGAQGMPALLLPTPGTPLRFDNSVKTVAGEGRNISVSQQGEKVSVSGTIGVNAPPYTDYQTVPKSSLNYGAVIIELLKNSGVKVNGKLVVGEVAKQALPLSRFLSRELTTILRDLNLYSNNFTAEQILFALGTDPDHAMSRELGLVRLKESLAAQGVPTVGMEIYDGSGLDRRNRLSTSQLGLALVRAHQDFSIAPDFIASLSRFGSSGTLKSRRILWRSKPENSMKTEHIPTGSEAPKDPITGAASEEIRLNAVWGKTGTLDGVSSLAGYALTSDGQRVAFVVISNSIASKPRALDFENGFVARLIGVD